MTFSVVSVPLIFFVIVKCGTTEKSVLVEIGNLINRNGETLPAERLNQRAVSKISDEPPPISVSSKILKKSRFTAKTLRCFLRVI
jgi:hypothetical protein